MPELLGRELLVVEPLVEEPLVLQLLMRVGGLLEVVHLEAELLDTLRRAEGHHPGAEPPAILLLEAEHLDQ